MKKDELLKAAIYMKDMDQEQSANLRVWVEERGFTDIVEYRDISGLKGSETESGLMGLIIDVCKNRISSVFVESIEQLFPQDSELFILNCLLSEHRVSLFSRNGACTNFPRKEITRKIQQYVVEQALFYEHLEIVKGLMLKGILPKKIKKNPKPKSKALLEILTMAIGPPKFCVPTEPVIKPLSERKIVTNSY